MWISRSGESNSQFPLVDGDGRVGICVASELHVLTIQVPVAVKALDFYLRLICIKAKKHLQAEAQMAVLGHMT